jgi:biopolymer transport protein ExbD
MARPVQEINAGSMADIAFLLLIFFLVVTTMDVDTGIIRKLPPPVEKDTPVQDINKRNIFIVLINNADLLLVNDQPTDIRDLKARAKEFLSTNHDINDERFPRWELVNIDGLGDVRVSKGVISLQNDRGTTYEMYIKVQNELTAAVNELRDEMARIKFGTKFENLKDRNTEYEAIRKAIPVAISEAEPVEIK